MEFYNINHIKIVVFSLFLGLIFGLLYDIIRIIHILAGTMSYSTKKREYREGIVPSILLGIGDALYMIIVTLSFSLFVYFSNNGDFRWFMAVGCAVGCALYHATLGKLVVMVSGTVANAIRTVIKYVVVRPAVFIGRIFIKIMLFVGRNTVGRLVGIIKNAALSLKTERARREIKQDIKFFGI